MRPLTSLSLIVLPLLTGAALVVALAAHRPGAEHDADHERRHTVSTIIAENRPLTPHVTGHGTVAAKTSWHAVAEVSGRVMDLHPDLEDGGTIPAGATVIQIDPEDYRIALARAEAETRAAQARLDGLESQAETLDASLDIERRNLTLADRALQRTRDLNTRGTAPDAAVDQAERDWLQSRGRVQELENRKALLPSERAEAEARLAALERQRDSARRDLERTTIRAPRDIIVTDISVEPGQPVQPGTPLARGDLLDAVDVSVHLPLDRLTDVLGGHPAAPEVANGMAMAERLPRLTARLTLSGDPGSPEWRGRVVRLGGALDPATRTIPVIVRVEHQAPYPDPPPARPPLPRGAHVAVTILGPDITDRIVLPRTSVRDGRVHLVDGDGRLVTRSIDTGARSEQHVTVEHGVAPGDQVLLHHPVPAIEGMLLEPQVMDQPDERTAAAADASGTRTTGSAHWWERPR